MIIRGAVHWAESGAVRATAHNGWIAVYCGLKYERDFLAEGVVLQQSSRDVAVAPNQAVCPVCGANNPPAAAVCRSCGTALGKDTDSWLRERDRLKTLWVVSVVMFWLSLGFQAVLYILQGETNLVLLSVIGGMLLLGVGLKIRLQLHERKKPGGAA